MLLRFSIDAGVTYYNTKDPRKTVPLNSSSPRRNLEECKIGCTPPKGEWITYDDGRKYFIQPSFQGDSDIGPTSGEYPHGNPFETCYQYRDERKYCWSKSWELNITHVARLEMGGSINLKSLGMMTGFALRAEIRVKICVGIANKVCG